MAYQLQIVLFCASLLVVTVIARPQVWNIGFNPRQTSAPTQAPTVPNTSTTAPVQATTPSKAFYNCVSRCPSTSEYNPICGSDSVNYHNLGRLNCAAMCGTAVTMVRQGTCLPLG
ncbi:uncharacterized protein LOC129910985 [Episyrphus balteatus]|uniref:uncharacterized protein LOC129910985 n=1 Tax=Episyrphus balteatus TaxID=286459 RepID=UPI0024850061|nr:uncharacterized protein LOC129910985 [Episyrphus balteatus]